MSTAVSSDDKKLIDVDVDEDEFVREEPSSDINVLRERLSKDPRFNPPTPSLWKRVALLITIIVLFYFAITMRMAMAKSQPEPVVVTAARYSKDYKFRPAASPVVTEKLKDGRIRVRGAHPTAR